MRKKLSPEQRLDVLRAADGEREWMSLDDERKCIVCGRVIAGQEIQITRSREGYYFLKCPTAGCPSNINHWLLCEPLSDGHLLPQNALRPNSGFAVRLFDYENGR